MHKLKRYFLGGAIFALVFIFFFSTWQLRYNLMGNIRLLEGESHYVNFRLPFVYIQGDRNDILKLNGDDLPLVASRIASPLNLEAQGLGKVKLEFSLLGLIPLRQITVDILPEVYLVPGGHSIGIKIHSQGVAVVGYYYFNLEGRNRSPAREAGIRVGDTLLAINGEKVVDVNQAAEALERAGANEILLLVNRDGKELNIKVYPSYSPADRGYRIGLYIRDSTAGVGTLSFYNPESGRYGALGHVIVDSDTSKPVNLSEGTIVKAKIIDIKAAQRGQPGEKTGIFMDHEQFRGKIDKNTPFGIFGRLENFQSDNSPYPDPVPLALASQVEPGPAEMLTVVDGEVIGSYNVILEKVTPQSRPGDKGIVLRVVDQELLNRTGGIVQGMSGSPLIQNGRLIGAVTHVFINDPTRGYGIFMEWMYQEAEYLTNN